MKPRPVETPQKNLKLPWIRDQDLYITQLMNRRRSHPTTIPGDDWENGGRIYITYARIYIYSDHPKHLVCVYVCRAAVYLCDPVWLHACTQDPLVS